MIQFLANNRIQTLSYEEYTAWFRDPRHMNKCDACPYNSGTTEKGCAGPCNLEECGVKAAIRAWGILYSED